MMSRTMHGNNMPKRRGTEKEIVELNIDTAHTAVILYIDERRWTRTNLPPLTHIARAGSEGNNRVTTTGTGTERLLVPTG